MEISAGRSFRFPGHDTALALSPLEVSPLPGPCYNRKKLLLAFCALCLGSKVKSSLKLIEGARSFPLRGM